MRRAPPRANSQSLAIRKSASRFKIAAVGFDGVFRQPLLDARHRKKRINVGAERFVPLVHFAAREFRGKRLRTVSTCFGIGQFSAGLSVT